MAYLTRAEKIKAIFAFPEARMRRLCLRNLFVWAPKGYQAGFFLITKHLRGLRAKGLPLIAKEVISEKDPEAYHDLPEDPEFVVRLKYLQYIRREELRICEAMDEKGRTIIERFNSTHESN